MSVGFPAHGSRSSHMFGIGPQAVKSSKTPAAPGDLGLGAFTSAPVWLVKQMRTVVRPTIQSVDSHSDVSGIAPVVFVYVALRAPQPLLLVALGVTKRPLVALQIELILPAGLVYGGRLAWGVLIFLNTASLTAIIVALISTGRCVDVVGAVVALFTSFALVAALLSARCGATCRRVGSRCDARARGKRERRRPTAVLMRSVNDDAGMRAADGYGPTGWPTGTVC